MNKKEQKEFEYKFASELSDEKRQASKRWEKLKRYTKKEEYRGLNEAQKASIQSQISVLNTYFCILNEAQWEFPREEYY